MFCWRLQIIFFSGSLSEDIQVLLLFSLRLGQGGEESAPY